MYERSDGSEAGYTLTSEVKLEWDERHRLVAEEQDGQRTEYRYDEAGRLAGTTTPDGETQREYDASGILTGYRSNGHRMDFGHSPAGLENRRYRPEDEKLAGADAAEPCGLYAGAGIRHLRTYGMAKTGRRAAGRQSPERGVVATAGRTPLRVDKSGRLTGHEVWSKTRTERERATSTMPATR